MRAYFEFIKKSFQNNLAYRVDYFTGVLNTIVMIFVNLAIWKAIYEDETAIGGIQFQILATYIILSFLLQTCFIMEDYQIEHKVRSGLISSDLLRPVNFKLYLFSVNIGGLLFRLTLQLLPALVVAVLLFQILPPFSLPMLFYFIISIALGYLVLYGLNFIVWVSAFWFYWTFSLLTIKDALVMVFSGALLPLWFMPKGVMSVIKLTPFESIYFTPLSIYLGQVPVDMIFVSIIGQAIWAVVLFLIGQVLWKAAEKKVVVQGG